MTPISSFLLFAQTYARKLIGFNQAQVIAAATITNLSLKSSDFDHIEPEQRRKNIEAAIILGVNKRVKKCKI